MFGFLFYGSLSLMNTCFSLFQTLTSVQNQKSALIHARMLAVWTLLARTSACASTALCPRVGQTCASVAELGNLCALLCVPLRLSPSTRRAQTNQHVLLLHASLMVHTWDCVNAVNIQTCCHREPRHNNGSYKMYKTYHCQPLFHWPVHILKKSATQIRNMFVYLCAKSIL